MKIVTKPLSELTQKEFDACYRLNMGDMGLMQDTLWDNKSDKEFIAIMLWGGYLYGWALLQPTYKNSWVEVTRHGKKTSKYAAQFYVRESMRGRGYGKKLMEEVIEKHDPRPWVLPHDDLSGSFFSNYKVSSQAYRRKLISKNRKRKAA